MFLSPMLLHTAEEPFNDKNYVFEHKANGVRCLCYQNEGKTKLYTRHNTDIKLQFPEFERMKLPNCYLDGEIICINEGKEDFESVMRRINTSKSASINKIAKEFPITYVVFDLLMLNGKKVINLPLIKRKSLLKEHISIQEGIVFPSCLEGNGITLFEQIKLLYDENKGLNNIK